MAAGLGNRVAVARPKRAGSGVQAAPKAGYAKPAAQAPHPTPAQNQAAENKATTTAAVNAGGSTLPWDATAEQEAGTAGTDYANEITGLGANWANRETYYGFGANGANNPYSQAALLATHHEWDQRGVVNGAGLNLYSGSTVNAHNQADRRYTTSYEQLLQAYEAERTNKVAEEEADRRNYENALHNAELGAIGRAAESAPEPVAAPSSDGGGGGGGGGGNQEQAGGVTGKSKEKKPKKIGVGGAKKA